jgi:cell division protein FtsI (penicillin-binding protein 3)
MGFFPAEEPQVAMLVILDEPQKDRWGGVASAPVFKAIGEQILTCFKTHIRPNLTPEEEQEKKDISAGVKFRMVSSSGLVNGNPMINAESDESLMPDFTGLSIRDALRKAKKRGIEITVTGNGWAVKQNPAPGTPLVHSTYCSVNFSHGN